MLEKEGVYDLTKQSALILTLECIGTFLLTILYQSCTEMLCKHAHQLDFKSGRHTCYKNGEKKCTELNDWEIQINLDNLDKLR